MGKKAVLVVDDEAMVRDMMQRAFHRHGYEVRAAESAEEALEILKKDRIRVMFLDLNLPGMNGLDLCRKIRKDFASAIIHAVTGYASVFEASECREAGFDVYYTKPVDMRALVGAARDAFEKLERWH